MNILQNFISPSGDFPIEFKLYYRHDNKTRYARNKNIIYTECNGEISFNTFYNLFPLKKWKKYTTLTSLLFNISGKGKLNLQFIGKDNFLTEHLLHEINIELVDGIEQSINISDKVLNSADTIVYVKIAAETDIEIHNMCFATTNVQPNNIKLGIVITHYNRIKEVNSSVNRLYNELFPEYSEEATIIVVDNSQNSGLSQKDNLTVINNKNLGGTGGFTKGLIELQQNNLYTHCIFMDDDASCEVEAIKRIINFLKYCSNSNIAISGMMIREDIPWYLHEKGGRYFGTVRPICHGLDLRKYDDLITIEREIEKIDYGAWFFFAFPLNQVKKYSFPFFVRGDDIQFSLINNFKIISLSGIGVYSSDFSSKDTPIRRYLSFRSALILLSTEQKYSKLWILKLFVRIYMAQVLSFNYSSAKLILLAYQHFSKGPLFFQKNIEMKNIFSEISKYNVLEKRTAIELTEFGFDFPHPIYNEKKLHRIFRGLTLNRGLHIRNKTMVYQDMAYHASFSNIYRYNSILYYDKFTETGYIAHYSRVKCLKALFAMFPVFFNIFFKFGHTKRKYKKNMEYMTSKDFWLNVFKEK